MSQYALPEPNGAEGRRGEGREERGGEMVLVDEGNAVQQRLVDEIEDLSTELGAEREMRRQQESRLLALERDLEALRQGRGDTGGGGGRNGGGNGALGSREEGVQRQSPVSSRSGAGGDDDGGGVYAADGHPVDGHRVRVHRSGTIEVAVQSGDGGGGGVDDDGGENDDSAD